MSPRLAAYVALALSVPLGIVWTAIVFELQFVEVAFKSVFTSDGATLNAAGRVYIFGSILVLPVALGLALWPMLRKGTRGVYWLNIAIALLILILMWHTWGGLAEDIYRCDILKIPNCD